ncbi:MAG: hypothetical protein GY841_17365 [FCB group bacterium]|nr:hypothetical protein [FCB group bacterium]
MPISEKYKITVITDTDYLHVSISGVWGGETSSSILNETIALYDEGRHRGLLTDVREMDVQTSPVSDYYNVRAAASSGFEKIKKWAAVVNPKFAEENSFFETAAQNAFINIRFFDADQDAIDWLNE